MQTNQPMNTQPARKLSMGERYADIVAEDRKSIKTASAQPENVRNPKGRPMLNSGEVDKVLIELEQVTAQRDELLAAAKELDATFWPAQQGWTEETSKAFDALHDAIRNAEQH